MRNIIAILIIVNLSAHADIFPQPSPYTGTTRYDFEAITPITPFTFPVPKETSAYLLSQELQKYLVSTSANDVAHIERLSNKYWEYALLSNAIYNENNNDLAYKHAEVDKSGWRLYSYYPDFGSGLVVGLYSKQGKYIVAIGGTTANSALMNKTVDGVLDILTDITLVSETIYKPDQLKPLKAWYKNLSSDIKNNIIAITGHSLGGGLAQYMGLMTGINTYTFNTAPMPLTYESSKDLNGGYSMGVIERRILSPYTPLTGPGSLDQEPEYITQKIYYDEVREFKYKDKITNIMSENDPLTTALRFISYTEQSKEYANIILKQTVLKALKKKLAIQDRHPLINLIVGKQVTLPFKTGHSIGKISTLLSATHILSKTGIYVLSDSENGKYYVYHLPKYDSDNKYEILTYATENEPLVFKNINTQKDWVYKYLLKLQEYGLSLSGDKYGNFDKNRGRKQGEIVLMIAKLFYKKTDNYGAKYEKYYKEIKEELPDFITKDTLHKEMTRGDMAKLFYHILEKYIPKNTQPKKGWKKESGVLKTLKIIGGYGDGTFKWDKVVSQAESLAFIINSYEYCMKDTGCMLSITPMGKE